MDRFYSLVGFGLGVLFIYIVVGALITEPVRVIGTLLWFIITAVIFYGLTLR